MEKIFPLYSRPLQLITEQHSLSSATLKSMGACVVYSSWERPQNERHNRIFRRFVPKGISIDRYTAEQILEYADSMNYLSRKILRYMTSEELFEAFLNQLYSVIKVQNVS